MGKIFPLLYLLSGMIGLSGFSGKEIVKTNTGRIKTNPYGPSARAP